MYFCYIDESGTPELPGNSDHYILAGLSIPIEKWKTCEDEISRIKKKYDLEYSEIHVAWIMRKYIEQKAIPNFENLSFSQRKSEVAKIRRSELLRLQRRNPKLYHQTKKNYRQTDNYTHLTFEERQKFIEEIASTIGNWQFARLFAECIDKIFFDPAKSQENIDEQAFEQVISRFEQYLQIINPKNLSSNFGLLIHDNNPTVEKKHTELMKAFHKKGTLWTTINKIIETPLFVNSELTGMIQIADVCAYGLRRYLENDEEFIFNHIFKRADRKDSIVVGIRHFTNKNCKCNICSSHKSKF